MRANRLAIARDLALLAPRLAAASLRVRRVQRADRAVQLAKFTSADWLAGKLGVDRARIDGARIEEVHTGTASRSRLHIRYPDAAAGPASLFLKSRPPDFGSALFGELLGLGGNEVAFYTHLRSELPVKAPQSFHCEGTSLDYVMLLEDLTDQDCRFQTLAASCTLEEATAVVTTLARLHGRFWDSDRFAGDLSWVNRFETNRDFRLLQLVRALCIPMAWQKFAPLLPPEIGEALPFLTASYPGLERRWAEGPRTLLHGDAHLGNMYFQAGEAGLFDWQVTQYGQGMRDVAYFLVNSLPTELRLAHQEDLIRHYLALLKDAGVVFDFDAAWRQYRLQSVYAWIAGIVTAPSPFQDEKVVIAGLTRACKAILDLDAIGLIRAL